MIGIYQTDSRFDINAMPRILLTGAETGGSVAVVEVTERRGAEPPLHIHQHEDEMIYVLAGRVTFHMDGRAVPCEAGGHVLLRRGGEHSYVVESDEARLLVVLLPAGLEQFYRERADEPDRKGVSDLEQLVITAARYGVDITGPPPDERGAVPSIR